MLAMLPLMRIENSDGNVGMWRTMSSVWDMLNLGHPSQDIQQVAGGNENGA